MRRVLVPIFGDRFFGGRFFGGSNGGGCRGSDGRPSSGTAGAADERERHQYQPDREREKAEEAATPIARHATCVYRKPRPFDLVKESRNVGHDGRAALLPFEAIGFAVQVD
jgi:hypothetical protein